MSEFEAGVRAALSKFLASSHQGRKVAVFDADGTLWRGDIGEAFFRHQIAAKTAPHAPPIGAWEAYLTEALEGDTVKAYAWLAQWNAGLREEDFAELCDTFFRESWRANIFGAIRAFTHELANAGFEVWVVTGSPRWIVQSGVREGYAIRPERVIGTDVLVEQGVLTDKLKHEVPYRAGKARLIEKLIGEKPLFAAGNTYWDKEMMNESRGLCLAIASEQEGEPNFDSEQKLQSLARSSQWLSQCF